MALGLHHSPMKRSHPCLDLMSMSGAESIDVTKSSASNKRLSSIVFGWDHYRSYEDSSVGKEYQSWRDKKRPRRHAPETQRPSSTSYKLSLHPAISPICEDSNENDMGRWSSMPPLSSSDVSYSSTDPTPVVDLSMKCNISSQSSLLPLVNDIADELAMTAM